MSEFNQGVSRASLQLQLWGGIFVAHNNCSEVLTWSLKSPELLLSTQELNLLHILGGQYFSLGCFGAKAS